jgi:hypothetical protein
MPFYIIRANGKFYDEVYTERVKTTDEIKKEYQQLLKIDNVKVKRVLSKG